MGTVGGAASGDVSIVVSDKGKLLVRVERYLDDEPTQPTAYARFLQRMAGFGAEAGAWKTVVLDSVTFMALYARKYEQYVMNAGSREPRQWFSGATDRLEEMLMMRFGALRCNVVVIAHIDEDKDELHGGYVRNPAAPGRLRKNLGSAYPEMYRAYVARQEDGSRAYLLQTQADSMYHAMSQIPAPHPCEAQFASMWAANNGKALWPVRVLVYGDLGGGKSTFAATYPKPMLVCMFDPRGKDRPYLRGGTELTEEEWRSRSEQATTPQEGGK